MIPSCGPSKRIWILIVSVLILLAVVFKSIDGFKLKDLTAHDQTDGNKLPSKSRPFGSASTNGGSKTPMPFRKITKIVKIEDDDEEEEINDEVNDDDTEATYKFEKVRKADIVKPEPIFETIAKEEEKEQDVVVEEAKETLSYSALSFLQMFGIGADDEGQESNALINWLRSFKREETKPIMETAKTVDPDESIFDSVFSYLDRWPFNLIIDFEKPDDDAAHATEPIGNVSHRQKQSEAPISHEQFVYLLSRLPSFVIDPETVQEIECKKQLQIFARQLRGQKLWTLQMFDSTGKISSGLLRGNVNQFGDFDQCTHIKTTVKISAEESVRIKGKYCLAHIDLEVVDNNLKLPTHMALGRGLLKSHYQNPFHFVPRYSTINWGVCLPNSCSAKTVKHMVETNLRMFNATGVYFHVDVSEKDCFIRRSYDILQLIKTNWKLLLTMTFYGSFLVMVAIGTAAEYWKPLKIFVKNLLKTSKPPNLSREPSLDDQSDDQGWDLAEEASEYPLIKLFQDFILSFSLKRSLSRLLAKTSTEDIAAINGLKVFGTFSIYLFLKFLMLGHLSITNRDHLVKMLSYPVNIVFRTPLIYLDTFLFVSGTVAAYRMCQEHDEKSGISIVRRIVGRLVRSLPTLFAVLYFQTWVMPHIGSGPLWSNLVSHNTKLCEQNLWRNFFTVQNAVNLEETCSPFTIQLAVDQQLYLLAPLIVWLYYNSPDIGLILYGTVHTISVAARFSKTISERLSPIVFHGMNVSQFYRTANFVYSSPIQRATAFVSGIGIGILLKSTDRPFKLPRLASWMGWFTACWCLVWCFWYPSQSTSIDFIYDPVAMAPYASWAPLLLSFSLGWITFTSFTDNIPSVVNSLLSSGLIQFLSRITYPMQMVSYVAIVYSIGVVREQTTFSIFDLISFNEIIAIVIISTVIAVIFDLPMQNIRQILIEFEFPDSKLAIENGTPKQQLRWFDDKPNSAENEETKENIDETTNQEESSLPDDEPIPGRVKLNRFDRDNGDTEFEWRRFNDIPEDSWRTESDLDQQDSGSESQQHVESAADEHLQNNIAANDEENEIEEEEEDEDISESDEVIRRPINGDLSSPNFRRRPVDRWNADED